MVLFCLIKIFKDKSLQFKHERHLFLKFIGSYLFFISFNLLNEILKEYTRLALVGVSIWGLTLGNLYLLKYCFYLFSYDRDSNKNRIKLIYSIHFSVSIISTFLYSAVIYIYHGYEVMGKILPIWIYFAGLPLLFSYLAINLTFVIWMHKLYIVVENFTDHELSAKNKYLLRKKIHVFFILGINVILMLVGFYLDIFYTHRTIYGLIGWVLFLLMFITIMYAQKIQPEKAQSINP